MEHELRDEYGDNWKKQSMLRDFWYGKDIKRNHLQDNGKTEIL
jgi:hypothetical protein